MLADPKLKISVPSVSRQIPAGARLVPVLRHGIHRRAFLGASLASAFLAPALVHAAVRQLRILVLGGTLFLGPSFVDAAVANGHEVTLFNRGITNPDLFPTIEKLRGYRASDPAQENLSALACRHWDVVVDVWPNDPSIAETAARRLSDQVQHYVYISSIGAYDSNDWINPGVAEDSPLAPWNSSQRPYNRGKAESERRLHAILGDRLTIIRPGAIKGRRDDTPDLFVWLKRFMANDQVLAPGDGTSPVQIVDVRDVADFMLIAAERRLAGAFNVTGPEISFREFLEVARSAVHSSAQLVWVPRKFLEQQGLGDWSRGFPYFTPRNEHPDFYRVNRQKALEAGLQTRPLRETAQESLAWFATLPNWQFIDPLPQARQDELLAAWRQRR